MNECQKSYINILPASINSIFCYFNFSTSCIDEFEQLYGFDAWNNFKTILKLFYIEDGIAVEKQFITTDGLADNWYISIDKNNVDLFVEIGKSTLENEYVPLVASNILSIPKANQVNAIAAEIYMLDINNPIGLPLSTFSDCSNHGDSDSDSSSIYHIEIMKTAAQIKNEKLLEEYINQRHYDLSSSK